MLWEITTWITFTKWLWPTKSRGLLKVSLNALPALLSARSSSGANFSSILTHWYLSRLVQLKLTFKRYMSLQPKSLSYAWSGLMSFPPTSSNISLRKGIQICFWWILRLPWLHAGARYFWCYKSALVYARDQTNSGDSLRHLSHTQVKIQIQHVWLTMVWCWAWLAYSYSLVASRSFKNW